MNKIFPRVNLEHIVLTAMLTMSLVFSAHSATVSEDLKRADKWNKFVDDLYTLHKKRVASRETYTEEENGGYGGLTNDMNFYHEVRHYDTKTGKLLSNIKWENKNPEKIHVIELYIYDDQGRIQREYTAAYLPVHRKAPFQTLINIHHYGDELHGFRQFDASNNRIFEFCSGKYFDETVHIALDDYEIPDSLYQIRDETQREAYRACFSELPKTAHPYINPLEELSLLDAPGLKPE